MQRDQFIHVIRTVLVEHPDWMLDVLTATTAAVAERSRMDAERVADISTGLVMALDTKRGAKRRRPKLIIKAIDASNYAGTEWAEKAKLQEADHD